MSQQIVPRGQTLVERGKASGIVTAAFVALLWVLEAIDTITFHALDALGVQSWRLGDLWSVLTHPLAHLDWQHLANNSALLLVLGFLVGLDGLRRWSVATAVPVLGSGLAAWALNPPGVNTLGASGLVFGWLTYLLVRGWYSRRVVDVLLAVVLFMVYGSVLWGVLPSDPTVSWQGHLGGAVGGVLAAWLVHRGRRP